ncbi:Protein of unknown function [Actinacidiphila paucisporea]|uniref:DUF998 domain-containing protein n=1 Tax=Actinacidiphila paucisporea TaxID=310782 RepID=A0A1M7MX01_9ACTN|nr:DUF998 domain-containing protein [Actinacidiphila paucisporea]SHM95586.1 Protein of unknown function [Actinacidiphila paucisporea]
MGYVTWWAVVSSGCAPVLLIGGSTTAAVLEGPSYNPVHQTISVLAAGGPSGYWVLTGMLIALGVCHLATACGLRAARLAGRLALGAGGVSAMVLAFFPAPKTGGSFSHGSVVAVGFSLLALWPVLAAWPVLTRDRWPLAPGNRVAAGARLATGSPGAADPQATAGPRLAPDPPLAAGPQVPPGPQQAAAPDPEAATAPEGAPDPGPAPDLEAAPGSAGATAPPALPPWGLRRLPSLAATTLMALGAAWFLVEIQVNGAAGVAERVLTIVQSLWPVVVVLSCLHHARRTPA